MKRKFWIISFFIFFYSSFFCALWARQEIQTDNGYVSLANILKLNAKLQEKIELQSDYLEKTFTLQYQKNKIRFALEKDFLISNGYFIPLQSTAIWKNKQVYLSLEMAEEIMSELALPIQYNFLDSKVQVKSLSKDEYISNKNKLKFIVIDPGHGGLDSGAIGATGKLEKDIVLSLSSSLFYYLRKQFPQLTIYITRLDDTYLSLPKRSEIANKKNRKDGYGIFISIHSNATLSSRVHGYEIYYLAQNSHSTMSRQLSLKENSGYITGADLYAQVLQSVLVNAQIQKESKMLAREMNKAFVSYMDSLVSSRGVKKADFSVLRATLMPAILIETGYLTNKEEEKVLQSSAYKKRLLKAIAAGIRFYMKVARYD